MPIFQTTLDGTTTRCIRKDLGISSMYIATTALQLYIPFLKLADVSSCQANLTAREQIKLP